MIHQHPTQTGKQALCITLTMVISGISEQMQHHIKGFRTTEVAEAPKIHTVNKLSHKNNRYLNQLRKLRKSPRAED